jgi:replication-associated recombination protein RarA
MTNKITITVSGGAGVGKTSVADVLFKALSDMGFVTAQVDSDSTDFRSNMTQEQKDKQIEYLKSNVVIVIDERQALRSEL